jgi:carboxymethylenebutenolidase
MSAATPSRPRAGRGTFESNGRPVQVERFEPPVAARAAALILHGADGLAYRGPSYRELARGLADDGLLALLVHYFDSTGDGFQAFLTEPFRFMTWMQAVADGVGYARTQFGAGPAVGLVGFSLGAYLSLAVAAQDERVGAVVDVFGGLHDLLVPGVTRLPPVLILHGDADPVVPVSEAHKLEKLLQRLGTPHEKHIYPGLGHAFYGAAAEDAFRRMAAFLTRHLVARQGEPPGLPRRSS